jgi:hypothetical protein
MELIANWVEGGMSKGNNPNMLPKPPKFDKDPLFKSPKTGISVSGEFTLDRALTIDGILPEKTPEGASLEITALLPNGGIRPLVWLYEYKDSYRHPFLFAKPLELPAGSVIRGVPSNAEIILIPGKKGSRSQK